MTTSSAELASMAATIEEMTQRLASIADFYQAERREDLVSEVHEVERALTTALRRLSRLKATAGA